MWLMILIFIVGMVYLLSMQGITDCNSGSSFALVKSIVEKGKLSINEFVGYTKYMDCAKRKGNYYTDRPPGTAFAAVPIYLLKRNVTLVSVISGVLSTVLVYLITKQLVGNSSIAFLVGLIFAFCTLNWKYSTTFLIHSLSTFLILLAVYGFFINLPILFIGIILGLATLVEYTNFIHFLGINLAQLILGNFSMIPLLIIGYGIGIIPLLLYNKKCFGSLFTTSYKYGIYFKWSNSPKTTFVTPILKGITGLLFYIKKKKGIGLPGGLLILSPVLIFGIIGYYFLPYHVLVLFLGVTVPLFLLISKHKTYFAGGAGDYRYLSSMVPYVVIPIGLILTNLSFLWPIILFLAIVSFIMIISRMLTLTITEKDLQEIDPLLIKKIKKKKIALIEFLRLKYLSKLIILIIKGLFIKKIHLEKDKKSN